MADTVGNILRIEGFKANVAVNGVSVKVTDTALSDSPEFLALVDNAAAVDPSMPLGVDIREATIVATLRDWLSSTMRASTTPATLTATINGTTFELTKRDDNPASPFVQFEAVRVV